MSNGNIENEPAAHGIGAESRRRELRALLVAAADAARASRQHVAVIEYVERRLNRLVGRASTLLSAG